jgi:UDP-2,4-diacetamido-2,4,6-trideoxy-beta-L-altropyranose hydrolase
LELDKNISSKELFLRVDSNYNTGNGHFMRCLALAQIWKTKYGKVTFISSCESELLRNWVTDEGFGLITVERIFPDPSDLEKTLSTINNLYANNSWVVLDGYQFNTDYQQGIKNNGNPLLVIDDIAHLDHYVADLILNQNLNAEELSYSCGARTKLLLGTDFVLLRDEFYDSQNIVKSISNVANKILVTLGTNDHFNITLKILEAIDQINIESLEIIVVIGSGYKHLNSLQNIVNNNHNIRLLENVSNMPELMVWSDFAFSAGGSTCWELAFLGVPIIIIELAENQKYIAKELDNNNIAINLGWHREVTYKQIKNTIKVIVSSKEKRKSMGLYGLDLIDGRGRFKVSATMRAYN